MRILRIRFAFLGALSALLFASIAHGVQRTFVSTAGTDASASCSVVAPCRGFAKAITLTDPGGEIVVLDSGGYGVVTINKNVTMLAPAGVYAGISVFAASDGVTVTSPATKVVLRGLTINGQGGNDGIRIHVGEVHVENVVISNMVGAGIRVEGATSVRVSGTTVRDSGYGIVVTPVAVQAIRALVRESEMSGNTSFGLYAGTAVSGASAQVTIERSSVTHNGEGLWADAQTGGATLTIMQSVASENSGAAVRSNGSGATVFVRESAITRNGTGLQQTASGVLHACGGNLLVANGVPQSGAILTSSCLDVAAGAGTVTNVATGAGLSGGPITTSGTIDLASTQLLPTAACEKNQVAKWSGSAWMCAGDANSGGTVTSVGTGTGLTGGPITTSGALAIADGGVGNAQLADGAVTGNKIAAGSVGSSQIAASQVQLRVAATCSRGVPMIGINADGTPICDNPVKTIPSVTYRTSVAIRADGRPIVARDGGNLFDCADADCTSGTDILFGIGYDVAMALRSDGRPVVTAGDNSHQILVICGDSTCTPGLRVTRLIDSGSMGTFSGLALRPDNTAIVAYYEFTTGQTRLYVCADPSCASGNLRIITSVATPSGVRIRPNGSPVIALRDFYTGPHSLYDCNDATCSSGTIRNFGNGPSIRFLLGIAVRADNRPIVVDSGPVMHDCADASCSSSTPRPFDPGEFITASAAVVRGDGRPLLAYGTAGYAVKLFDCADAACTFGTVRLVDQANVYFTDREVALAVRPDGRPVLSYPYDTTSMRVLVCRTATCQ